MRAPLILGGIQVPLTSGAPDVSYAPAGGRTDVVLSNGRPIPMRHWRKELITISGAGWMATGLDALDWDAEHVLMCPKPKRVASSGTSLLLTADPRPDVPVEAQALVNGAWISAAVEVTGRQVSVAPVAGASQYSVVWYPQFTVLCTPPGEESADGEVSWVLVAREV